MGEIIRTDANGLDFIKSFEGFMANKYLCPGGYVTIGYGHLLHPNEQLPDSLSPAQAEELLIADVVLAEAGVGRFIDVPLNRGQHLALTSFVFNLGPGALQRSTLRRLVNREEHDAIPDELLRWVWAAGRKLPGLTRRRYAEGCLYSDGN